MKYGIFYSYWEKDWVGDYFKYVRKARNLGMDVLEISPGPLLNMADGEVESLGKLAQEKNIEISCNLGPLKEYDVASADPEVRKRGIRFQCAIMDKMTILGSNRLSGGLYSFWPYDFVDLDKPAVWKRSVESVKVLGEYADHRNIVLCMEVLNRFENLLMNTAQEGVAFCEDVDMPSVKLLLDTFHMNIEEDCIADAIHTAGKHLGHFHVGENNRKLPFDGKESLNWMQIGKALNDIGYEGYVVAEPFVTMGGQIGRDIKVWRDLSGNADEAALDAAAAKSTQFLRAAFAKK